MLLLLSVDGLDYELIKDMNISFFKYNKKLDIPKECYIMSAGRMTPHTTRVWASIFTGNIIDYGSIRRTGLRLLLHNILVNNSITWNRTKKKWLINPYNKDLDTIFYYYHSFNWNCPTISPEWLSMFPTYQYFEEYCKRELLMWSMMSEGATSQLFDVCSFYTRYVDYIGHNRPDELEDAYRYIFNHAKDIDNSVDVILLSDHGNLEKIHTDYAYIGSNHHINANSIDELRKDFERILRISGIEKLDARVGYESDYTKEEEDEIKRRLRNLGYIE